MEGACSTGVEKGLGALLLLLTGSTVMRVVHKHLYSFALCKLNVTQQENVPKHFGGGKGKDTTPPPPRPPPSLLDSTNKTIFINVVSYNL